MDTLTILTVILIVIGTIANIQLIRRLIIDEQFFARLGKRNVLKNNHVEVKNENDFLG